jgi:hypothetical protein
MPPDSPRRWQSSPPTWSSKPDPILGRTASSRNHASRSPRATACRQSGKRRLRSRFAAERHSYRTGDPHRRRARAQSTQRAGGTKRFCVEGGASLRSRRTIRLTRHKASGSVLGTSVDAGLSEGPPSRTPPDTFRQRSWSPRWGGNSVIASVALVTGSRHVGSCRCSRRAHSAPVSDCPPTHRSKYAARNAATRRCGRSSA